METFIKNLIMIAHVLQAILIIMWFWFSVQNTEIFTQFSGSSFVFGVVTGIWILLTVIYYMNEEE